MNTGSPAPDPSPEIPPAQASESINYSAFSEGGLIRFRMPCHDEWGYDHVIHGIERESAVRLRDTLAVAIKEFDRAQAPKGDQLDPVSYIEQRSDCCDSVRELEGMKSALHLCYDMLPEAQQKAFRSKLRDLLPKA